MSRMPGTLVAMLALAGCASQPSLRHAYDPIQAHGKVPARIDTRPGLALNAVDDYNSCNFVLFCTLPRSVMVLPGEHTLDVVYRGGNGTARGQLKVQAAPGEQYYIGYEIKDGSYIHFLVEPHETAKAAPDS